MSENDFIDLPAGLSASIQRPTCMEELRFERNFYYGVLSSISNPENYVVMSDASLTDVKDYEGIISIWCKNKHTKTIDLIQIKTYFDIAKTNITPDDWTKVLNYLINYHNIFTGEVLFLSFVQGDIYWKLSHQNVISYSGNAFRGYNLNQSQADNSYKKRWTGGFLA